MSKYVPLRGKRFSFFVSRRTVWVLLALLAATLVVFVVSTGVGSVRIAPLDVVKTLLGSGTETNAVIVKSLRLPRMIIAILVGAALAVSGAILQGMVRNPLTSPDIIGITWGAALGGVCYFYFASAQLGISWLPLFAMVGAFATTALIYVLGWKRGVAPLRLVLIGIGMSAAFSSLTYMLLLTGPMALANKSLTFMTGSIYGSSWDRDVVTLLPWVGVLLPAAFVLARDVNVQELGEEIATGVGSPVQRKRLLLLLVSVALAGAAVAIAGAIGFIGLMAPHIARKLVGPAFGGVLPVAALIGALILMLADLVARTAFTPLDIPAGVFTAAIGAPFFIYLLYRSRNR